MSKWLGQSLIWLRLVTHFFRSQRTRFILIIIQLCIGFFCIGIALGMLEGSQRFISQTKQIAPTDTIQLWLKSVPSGHTIEQADELYEPYEKIMSEISNHEYVEAIGSFVVENYPYKGERYSVSFMDYETAEILNLNLRQGREFTEEEALQTDYEPIPAVISHHLAKESPLDTTFPFVIHEPAEQRLVEKELQTVGVLRKNNFYWLGGASHIIQSLRQDDYYMILPMQTQIEADAKYNLLSTNTLIQLTDPAHMPQFKADVRKIIGEDIGDWEMHTVQQMIDQVKEENRTISKYTGIFAIVLFGLSALGLLGVTLASILLRQREFGIRYAMGSPPLFISLLIVGEVILLVFCSALISTIGLILVNKFVDLDHLVIGPFTMISSFGLVLLISSLVSVFPAYRAYKTEPIEMIRGTK